MTNLYDTANQLEKELRSSEQFIALQEAYKALQADEAAFALFKEFQMFQQTLQQKMMAGEEMTEEDAEQAQTMTEQIQSQTLVNELMQKEQAFSLVVNDLNRIIMTPVRELYEA